MVHAMDPGKSSVRNAASRRPLLKAATAASGAALAEGALRHRVYAAGSDVVRIGIIGCGARGGGAAVQAMDVDPGVRLVAMCDLFAERVQTRRAMLQRARPAQVVVDDAHCFVGFDGYKGVIESVDAVLITNAAKFHPLHAQAAVEAGRHVFVEKPHAIDPPGLKRLIAASELARKKKLSLVSGLQNRFLLGCRETVRRVRDGAIGDIVAIEGTILQSPYGTVRRRPGLGEVEYQITNQKSFTWIGGGDVCQSLVHNLDLAAWAMGEQPLVKCHGLGGRSSSFEQVYGDSFDHHALVYEFATGVKLYAFARTAMGCYNRRATIVFGTRGRANLGRGLIYGEKKWHYRGRRVSPYDEEQRALLAAFRKGKPTHSGTHIVNSTLAAIMGQMSCHTGNAVTRDQVLKSDFCYPPKPEECSLDMPPPVRPGPDGLYRVPIPGKTKLL